MANVAVIDTIKGIAHCVESEMTELGLCMFNVVKSYESIESFLTDSKFSADLIVAGYCPQSGANYLSQLREMRPQAHIIMVSGEESDCEKVQGEKSTFVQTGRTFFGKLFSVMAELGFIDRKETWTQIGLLRNGTATYKL